MELAQTETGRELVDALVIVVKVSVEVRERAVVEGEVRGRINNDPLSTS